MPTTLQVLKEWTVSMMAKNEKMFFSNVLSSTVQFIW